MQCFTLPLWILVLRHGPVVRLQLRDEAESVGMKDAGHRGEANGESEERPKVTVAGVVLDRAEQEWDAVEAVTGDSW